jgi:hypothetical protein
LQTGRPTDLEARPSGAGAAGGPDRLSGSPEEADEAVRAIVRCARRYDLWRLEGKAEEVRGPSLVRSSSEAGSRRSPQALPEAEELLRGNSGRRGGCRQRQGALPHLPWRSPLRDPRGSSEAFRTGLHAPRARRCNAHRPQGRGAEHPMMAAWTPDDLVRGTGRFSERGPVDLLHPGGNALPGVSSCDCGSFLGRSPAYTSIAKDAPHRFRDTRHVRRHDVPDPSIDL